MKHDFTDKYSHLDSPLHRLDPRAKVVTSFAGLVIVVSEPLTAGLYHMLLYSALLIVVTIISRLPVSFVLKRLLIVSPFVIMAALFFPLSQFIISPASFSENYHQATGSAIVIFFRAFLALLILILLTSTEKFHRLLLALRKLKMPKLICSISALLYRYIFLLTDEALRTSRARESRTPGKILMSRTKVYGNQVATIFIKSWERSQIIYKSMLSRGFTGEYPDMQKLRILPEDIVFPFIFLSLMLIIRIIL